MRKSSPRSIPIVAAAVLSFVTLMSGFAEAGTSQGAYIGTTADVIKSSLELQGYQVRKVEFEDGYLEAYTLMNGERFEIYIDPTSGEVAKIKSN